MIHVYLAPVGAVQILTLATLILLCLKMMAHVSIVVVPKVFLKATAIVMEISSMYVEFVVVIVHHVLDVLLKLLVTMTTLL